MSDATKDRPCLGCGQYPSQCICGGGKRAGGA